MPQAPGRKPQAVRVVVANETAAEAVVALSDLGKYVNVDVASLNTPTTTAEVASDDDDDDDDGTGVRLYQSIYETALRNKVPATVIEDMIRVYSYDVDFQRRVQAGDSFEVFFAGEDERAEPRRQERGAVRLAHGRRRNQEILPLPDTGRRGRRLLRRDRQEREEVPRPQTRQQRDDALWLRLAAPPDPRLLAHAYRRRLGHRLRHADLRLRQRRDRKHRLGRRLRQVYQHQASERLRDGLRPHVGLRQGHGGRQARAPGPGDRLCRLDRPLDRRARALRNQGQRPLRRSVARAPAARPLARRRAARPRSSRSATASKA